MCVCFFLFFLFLLLLLFLLFELLPPLKLQVSDLGCGGNAGLIPGIENSGSRGCFELPLGLLSGVQMK